MSATRLTSSRRPASAGSLPSGRQDPRVSVAPVAVASAGAEAAEMMLLAGVTLDEWQRLVLDVALGERRAGRWSAATVGVCLPRQNGKNEVLVARELWGLFLGGERLIVHTAHRQRIATQQFRRLVELTDRVPAFKKRVKSVTRGRGSEAVTLVDGRRIEFTTRLSGNLRGLTADLIVFDEAAYLADDDLAAIIPTLSALSQQGNPQVWFTGSPPDREDPVQDGVPFSRLRESALNGADGVAWLEWSVDAREPDMVPMSVAEDPEMWAVANPALGVRISHEWVRKELTVDLSARAFAVERLGVGSWPSLVSAREHPIPLDVWQRLAEHDRSMRVESRVAVAVDATPEQSWGCVAVAGLRGDGLWQVAVVEHRRGCDWVPEVVARLLASDRPPGVVVVDGRGPAAHLIDVLRDMGAPVLVADTGDLADGCAQFLEAVTAGDLRWPAPQPELEAAVGGARRDTPGDRWKWSRRRATANIAPLVAATLALWGARQPAMVPTVWSISEAVRRITGDQQAARPGEPVSPPGGLPTSGWVPLNAFPARGGRWR